MSDKLKDLARRLGHSFQDMTLLDHALRHRSSGALNNERFEFLGDAILGFVISSELYQRYKQATEGELSRMRSFLVNGEILAEIALDFEVNTCLYLGLGEQKSGGSERQSILADAMEAIIGAIYLDAGIEASRGFIIRMYGEKANNLSDLEPKKDAKSQLQEWLQAKKLPLPSYVLTVEGRAHALTFKVVCQVEGLPYSSVGESSSRRKAEQIAAKHYMEKLHEQK